MLVVFGTGFFGKVATHKGNWIETKFFSFMFLPVFPLKSMLVTESEFRKRRGIDIDTNSKSVIAAYGRMMSTGLALFFGYSAISGQSSYESSFSVMYSLMLAFLFSGLAVYFFLFYGKATTDDIVLRDKVGSIVGVYAMPHWFDHYFLHAKLDAFQKLYKNLYPENNWKDDLRQTPVDGEKLRLLYAISLFNYMVMNAPEDDELYAIADELYIPKDGKGLVMA